MTASVRQPSSISSAKNSPLRAALREAKLEQYYTALRSEGIVDPAELSLVSTQDLDRIGLKKFEKMRFARNFLIGGGGSMHSNHGGSNSSSNANGLLDLPLSSLDQQALLQLLTPFIASNGGIKGGSAAAVKQLMAGYDRATAAAGGSANGIHLLGNSAEAQRQLAMVAAAASSSLAQQQHTTGTTPSNPLFRLAPSAPPSTSPSTPSSTSSSGPSSSSSSSSSSSLTTSASSKDMVSLLFKRGSDQSSSKSDRLQAVKAIRTLLSAERDDIAITIIEQGLLPQLVQFLDKDKDSELQLEALSALTNLVVSQADHTHFLLGTGIVPVLVALLKDSNDKSEEILEKAVWVLGNIAGDSAVTRDAVLTGGALVPMIGIIDRSCSQKSMRLLRVSVWCVSNLCDGPSMLPNFPAKNVIGAMIQALGTFVVLVDVG